MSKIYEVVKRHLENITDEQFDEELRQAGIENQPEIKKNITWEKLLQSEFQKPYFKDLKKFIHTERKNHTVYPAKKDIFNALRHTPYRNIKVIILGQDPYPNPNQAHGLCFSVNENVPIPKSLQNIFKELQNDCGCYIPNNGYLKKWANQGVLLLNTVLTVRAGSPNSHKDEGWERFTDKIISLVSQKEERLVFILWGMNARNKKKLIDPKHYIIESSHPSPLSAYRGFLGSKPFSKTNAFLTITGRDPIDWQIENV